MERKKRGTGSGLFLKRARAQPEGVCVARPANGLSAVKEARPIRARGVGEQRSGGPSPPCGVPGRAHESLTQCTGVWVHAGRR